MDFLSSAFLFVCCHLIYELYIIEGRYCTYVNVWDKTVTTCLVKLSPGYAAQQRLKSGPDQKIGNLMRQHWRNGMHVIFGGGGGVVRAVVG